MIRVVVGMSGGLDRPFCVQTELPFGICKCELTTPGRYACPS
jgi:hypothetical protein